jgi:Tol biopolymer transport system component
VAANGGAPQLLTAEENHEIDPGWSPDGSRLVFEQAPWEERGANRATGIALIDLKTRQVTTLPGSEHLVSPRWSPDGKYIAAMPADSSGLLLFDFSTAAWTRLLSFHIGYPNWSHDSKYLYFDRFAEPAGVGRVRVRDHSVENVLTPARGDQLWSIDSWTGVTPDDAVLLVRDASLEEIYALRWRAR